jgi:hypothetical protein
MHEDLEAEEFASVSVGRGDAALWDIGEQAYLSGTRVAGSARVLFSDKRDRMLEVLNRVQRTGEPQVIPVPRAQVWLESAVAAAPARGQRRLLRSQGRRSLRVAAATGRRTDRGRGD